MNLPEIIKNLRKRSLGSIKITLFGLFISGLLIDFSIKFNKNDGTVEFLQGSTGNYLATVFIIIFVFLILIDVWDWKLRHSQKEKLLGLIENKDIDPETKMKLVEKIESM